MPTFYVDAAIHPFRDSLYCHLMSDGNDDDLRAFAARLGMPPDWIQKPGTAHAHFDLSPGMRAKAVRAGAVEVSGLELARRVIRPKRERRVL